MIGRTLAHYRIVPLPARKDKGPRESFTRPSRNNPGGDLLSHTVTRAVPSAVAGLTSVFGMGTGVTLIL